MHATAIAAKSVAIAVTLVAIAVDLVAFALRMTRASSRNVGKLYTDH